MLGLEMRNYERTIDHNALPISQVVRRKPGVKRTTSCRERDADQRVGRQVKAFQKRRRNLGNVVSWSNRNGVFRMGFAEGELLANHSVGPQGVMESKMSKSTHISM